MKETHVWRIFRFVFVIFSLYLIRDAFFRWDGFSFYASFSEFIPSVALAAILWSIVAVFTAILIWFFFRIILRAFRSLGQKMEIEHLLMFVIVSVLSGALIWKGKKILWPDVHTTLQVKVLVFVFIITGSALLIWKFRGKAIKWSRSLEVRLTPLVWSFSVIVFFSFPLVIYHTWIRDADSPQHVNTYSSEVDGKRQNIILVTFDALAATNMSTYGYKRETTPFISKWGGNATRFTRTEANSNFTTPAAASLMTGKRVWTHQTYHVGGMKPLRSNVESLPAVLKNYGYFNIALVVNPFASVYSLGMSRSFDRAPPVSDFSTPASFFGWKFGHVDVMLYRLFGRRIRQHNWILKNDFILSKVINLFSRNIYQTTVPPRKVFKRFMDIIDHDFDKPFFAWIHLFPPHDPYLPPEPYKGHFNSSSELRTYKSQERLIEASYKYLFQYQGIPKAMYRNVDLMRDYYDEFVRYCDKEFEWFINELGKRDIDNTFIILAADHGESFNHGYFTHGGPFLYEHVTRIPLIIKTPGQREGQTVDDLAEQIDIPATILDLVNIPVPQWMEGRSLAPYMRGEKLPQRPAFSMNFEENRSRGQQISRGSIAVWEGRYKLIHYLQKNESLLFDLKLDPGEANNVLHDNPGIGRHLLRLILDNLSLANKFILQQQHTIDDQNGL